MKRTETHIYFWGSEFSNFHPCVFMYKGMQFANSEQAFMWEKAKFFGHDDIAVQILNAESPKYRDWETDRKSTRLNSSHSAKSRMPSSA